MRAWSVPLILLCLVLNGCSQGDAETAAPPGETVEIAKSDYVFCDVVDGYLSQSDCDNARRIEGKVKAGVGAFNVPLTMVRGRTIKIQLAVGQKREPEVTAPPETKVAQGPETTPPTDTTAAGEEPPPAPPQAETPADVVGQNEGEVIPYAPVIGRRMAADLTGAGFKIDAVSPRVQTVSAHGLTTWEWAVTPTAAGPQSLTMKTSVVFQNSKGVEMALVSTTRSAKVTIKVGLLDYMRQALDGLPGWLKAITAVLTAATALFVAWRAMVAAARGKTPPKPPGAPEAPP